jgi:hypothetical protein
MNKEQEILLQESKETGKAGLTDRKNLLCRLARSLDPFPGFLGMSTIQAVELDPMVGAPDRGCVIVSPSGDLRELVIDLLPGPAVLGGVDHNDSMREIELSEEETEWYTNQGISILSTLLRERIAG